MFVWIWGTFIVPSNRNRNRNRNTNSADHMHCDGVAGAWITVKWREKLRKIQPYAVCLNRNENLKDFSCSKRDKHTKRLQIVSQHFFSATIQSQKHRRPHIAATRHTKDGTQPQHQQQQKHFWTNFCLLYLVPINGNWCRLYSHLVDSRNRFVFIIHAHPFVMDAFVICVL